jgi:hypothetical protein
MDKDVSRVTACSSCMPWEKKARTGSGLVKEIRDTLRLLPDVKIGHMSVGNKIRWLMA